MRLNETQIKETILHPNSEVRVKAINYFVDAYSDDSSVMPFVIETIRKHGRNSAQFRTLRRADKLAQSPVTLDWLIAELNLKCDRDDKQWDNYLLSVALIVCNADPRLIVDRREEIISSDGFHEKLIPRIDRRLQLHKADWRECWQQLAEFCTAHAEDESFTRGTTRTANDIVDALGLKLANDTDAWHICKSRFEELDKGLTGWLCEWSQIRLAGVVQDSAAIPSLLEKLAVFDFGFCDEAITALSRIGTDEVVQRIAEAFPNANNNFHHSCTDPLSHIHSESVVDVCLQLLEVAEDVDVAVSLGHAILAHFDNRAIAPVYELLAELGQEGLDPDSAELVYDLLLSSMIMDQRFPGYDELMDFAEQTNWGYGDYEEPRLSDKFFDDSQTVEGAVRAIMDEGGHPGQSEFEGTNSTRSEPSNRKIGRNDPCPCGSGKKYKKCCLSPGQVDPLSN